MQCKPRGASTPNLHSREAEPPPRGPLHAGALALFALLASVRADFTATCTDSSVIWPGRTAAAAAAAAAARPPAGTRPSARPPAFFQPQADCWGRGSVADEQAAK